MVGTFCSLNALVSITCLDLAKLSTPSKFSDMDSKWVLIFFTQLLRENKNYQDSRHPMKLKPILE